MEWDLEWGRRIKVLLEAERRGMNPQALRDKPDIPWYYFEFIKHYNNLSRSREYKLIQTKDKSYNIPNPIDIASILQYNEAIVKMSNPSDFLDIVQTLDDIFIAHFTKKMRET